MTTEPMPSAQTDEHPVVRRQKSGGLLLPALVTLFMLLTGLLLAGWVLLLPPFNLLAQLTAPPYAMLDAQNNATRSGDNALTLILSPNDTGEAFGVSLETTPADSFMAGSATDWTLPARAALPTNLTLESSVHRLQTTGTAPERVTVSLTIPQDVPDRDRLDMYGWDGERWRFVPSQPVDAATLVTEFTDIPEAVGLFTAAAPSAPTVLIPVDVTTRLTAEAGNVATIVTPAGMQPTLSGEITGSLAAGIEYDDSYRIMPVIRNFTDPRALDVETVVTIIGNDTLRQQHAQEVARFSGAFSGVFIDYRDIPDDQRGNFTRFIAELSDALQARDMKLGVVVPAAQNTSGSWATGAYDWRAIGQHADYVQVNFDRIDPTMFTPGEDRLVEALLRWAEGEISRYKLIVGLSAQSQRQASGGFEPIGYSEALEPMGDVQISGELAVDGSIMPGTEFTLALDGYTARAGENADTQTAYIDYLDENGNPITRVWLTTDEALNFRLSRLTEFAVGGVAFTDLTRGDLADNVLNAIANYKLALPFQPTRTDLYLQWRVEGESGVIAEATTALNESLVATVDAPEGSYNVNVAVVAESAQVRSGAQVVLAAPTATPTPLPSPTATPSPTPTNTPDPAAVAAAQAEATRVAQANQEAQAAQAAPPVPGGNFGAVAPGAGSIGAFEYGGHVSNAGSARSWQYMRQAGMTWMKSQVRYSPGGGTGDAANVIASARANGFKVLIGTVGSPNDLARLGDSYYAGYAAWLAEIAALGPDAIEVWNEPNIDREWPTGQISGEAYARMLQQAYGAIKGTNPNVIVISGAPAPTGAEAAYPGQVVNDDNWLRQLVNAGGLQYMDCLGMHYNEGIVPPNQRSGDPRDNYYTRYLGTMLDTYWNIVGGQRPICITELGYLTSEGYGALPAYFAWAQNVTLDQQAAWLAQAAAISSQSGRVRLMIIWNVDFTLYGADPQGGYAIIRPDGRCPACDALAAAR